MRVSRNDQTSGAATSGVSISGLLGIVFVVLKLCHVIDWSWWWVTAPFWGPVVIAILLIVGALVIAGWDS